MATIQWGDVGTWVGGVGTALAFLLAVILFRSQAAQQEQGREDARRELARRVWALVVGMEETASVPQSTLGPPEFNTVRTFRLSVTVTNHGDEPVWGCVVGIRSLTRNPVGVWAWGTEHAYVGIIAPGVDTTTEVTLVEPFSPANYTNPAVYPAVDVMFQDATGRAWVRQGSGQLDDLGLGDLGIIPSGFTDAEPGTSGPDRPH